MTGLTLKSGTGQSLPNPKQKVAIALSEKQKAAPEFQAPNLMNALKKKRKGTT